MKIESLRTWIRGALGMGTNLSSYPTPLKPRTHLTLNLQMASSSNARDILITKQDVRCLLSREVTPTSTYECCLYEITQSGKVLITAIPIGVEATALHGALGNQSQQNG